MDRLFLATACFTMDSSACTLLHACLAMGHRRVHHCQGGCGGGVGVLPVRIVHHTVHMHADALNRLAPENIKYRHDDEGPDDMPGAGSALPHPGPLAHMHACLLSSTLSHGHASRGQLNGRWHEVCQLLRCMALWASGTGPCCAVCAACCTCTWEAFYYVFYRNFLHVGKLAR